MNAVIVDIRKKMAAALDESGRIIRIRNNEYEIGQQIELHEVKPVRSAGAFKRVSSGVAAAVLIAMLGTGTAYALPYGTVTLEGEPSLEYRINCFDYVLDVQAANEEGEELLAEMDLKRVRHHRIDKAITETMEQFELDGYLENAEAPVRISADTKNDRHTERLQQELDPMAERPAPPVVPGDERNDRVSENTEDAFRPEKPDGQDPQSRPAEALPTNPNGASHQPDGPYPDAESNSGEAYPDAGGADEHPPQGGFTDDMTSGGDGMTPGTSQSAFG